MNNYELSRMIVEDVLQKVRSNESVMYMEYVRSVEAILNKYAAQQKMHTDVCPVCVGKGFLQSGMFDECHICNGTGKRG